MQVNNRRILPIYMYVRECFRRARALCRFIEKEGNKDEGQHPSVVTTVAQSRKTKWRRRTYHLKLEKKRNTIERRSDNKLKLPGIIKIM